MQRIPFLARQRGLTLIECSVALTVAALCLSTAVPHFGTMVERKTIEGAAAQLATDLHYTRSLAVANGRSLRMSFKSTATGTCYVIHTGAAGDCSCNVTEVPVCSNGAELVRAVPFANDGLVNVHSNSASILVSAEHGTVTPTATLRVEGRSVGMLKVVVNIMGRVRTCTTTPSLRGYAAC